MEFKNNIERELYLSFKFFMDTYSRKECSFGLVPDSYPGGMFNKDSSIAGTGFFFAGLVVGVEHGFIKKEEAEQIALKSIKVIKKLKTYHGWYYHFYEMETGNVTRLSEISTIDTALLVAGLLTAGSYFGGEILKIARWIHNRMNFQYFLLEYKTMFSMSMNYQYIFQGHWDRYAEQLILYVLGAANKDPKHTMDKEIYYNFIRDKGTYKGYEFIYSWHGSLFTYQYSHAFVDFRNKVDRDGVNWFKNSVNASLAAYQYAIDEEGKFPSFHRLSWGLTACANKEGYSGRYGSALCGDRKLYNDGTVAPCGAIASIVFTPEQSIAALDYFYNKNIFNDYGLLDSYNEGINYTCPFYISIDKGITLLMLSNYLKGTIWKYFMRLEEIQAGLEKLEIKDER